jgi:hypothetical protein
MMMMMKHKQRKSPHFSKGSHLLSFSDFAQN